MSDREPQVDLPYAALHAPTHGEPHVDSEDAVQYERRRVPLELEPLESSRQSSEAQHASLRNSHASQEHLRRRPSALSTQPDIPVARPSLRSSRTWTKSPLWYKPMTKFWNTHISLSIDEGAHRDHLALERTFLGYLRTSLILVMTGVLIAQLFRLQHIDNPNPDLGFYVIGRPLSITFIGMAILVMLLGAFRFWKLQGGLVRGKAFAGGWEVLAVMVMSGLLLLVTFGLVVGVNVEKSLVDS